MSLAQWNESRKTMGQQLELGKLKHVIVGSLIWACFKYHF